MTWPGRPHRTSADRPETSHLRIAPVEIQPSRPIWGARFLVAHPLGARTHQSNRHGGPMIRTLSALAATTTALLLLIPSAAHANTYDVYTCWAGYGTFHNPNASSEAWTRDQASSGGHFAVGDLCGVDRGSGALSIVSLSGPSGWPGQNAEVAVTAPMGTTLAGASLWRRAWTYGTGSGGASQRNSLTALASGTSYLADADGTADVALGTRGTGDATNHGINSGNLLTLN